MIGETKVDKIIREVHPQAATSNPLTACKAAFEKLKLRNIALVTPYSPDVTLEMQANLRSAGFNTVAVASFNQTDDFTVARITSESILKAITNVGARDEVDGVFVSCTSLRTLNIINEAELQIDKPVITSNQALGWHLARLSGLRCAKHEFGRIFTYS
jgi:maleate isomerase